MGKRALVMVWVIACSGHPGTGADGGVDAGDGGASADAGDAASSGDGGDASGPLPYLGGVYLENRSTAQFTGFEAFSTFGTTAELKSLQCSAMQSGNCCYGPVSGTAGTGNAGTLTLLDGTATIGTMPSGSYLQTMSTPTLKWNVGDSLSVNAPGDPTSLAAFSVTATAPPVLTGVSPAFTTTTKNLSVANDFTVSFSTTSGGTDVSIEANTTSAFVACRVPTSAGSITLPHMLLATLSGAAIIEMFTFNTTVATTSNAQIALYVTNGEMNQYANFGP